MSSGIYYFSGTGNSKYAAKSLAEKISDTEVISITKGINKNNFETIGFVFPVYALGIPKIAVNLINSYDFSKARYIYAIATCGGERKYKGALIQFSNILKSKGVYANGLFGLEMGSNSNLFIQLPGNPSMLEPDERDSVLNKIPVNIKKFAEIINDGKNYSEDLSQDLFEKIITKIAYAGFIKTVNKYAKNFHTNEDCVSCGSCVESCQKNNIILKNKKPVWENNCEACLACFNACKSKALKFGKMKNPRMNERYIPLFKI